MANGYRFEQCGSNITKAMWIETIKHCFEWQIRNMFGNMLMVGLCTVNRIIAIYLLEHKLTQTSLKIICEFVSSQ